MAEEVQSRPFLTDAQRAALDAALANKANGTFKEVHHDKSTAGHHPVHGKPGDRKPRNLKGTGAPKKRGGGGKYTWGDLLVDPADAAIDENDPNYDSDDAEQPPERQQPARMSGLARKIEQYKAEIMQILQEYFSSGDINEAATSLQELDLPQYDYYFVKRAITLAMDRKDHDREMAATILSTLYGQVVTPDQMQKGFMAVVESLDDLVLDVPNAVDVLALFICRAVVDDILPPAFLKHIGTMSNALAADLKSKCEVHLSARHSAERLLRCWGAGAGIMLDETKESIKAALTEYTSSKDVAEVDRRLRELDVPFYHHEVVKQAVLVAIEDPKMQHDIIALIKHLTATQLISAFQLGKGLQRVKDGLNDLKLDNPDADNYFTAFVESAKEQRLLDDAAMAVVGVDGGERAASATSEGSLPSHTIQAFKAMTLTTLKEYFDSSDVSEVAARLQEQEDAGLGHIFVKHAVRMALDRRDREREMVSQLLVALSPSLLPVDQLTMGFARLLSEVDDMVLDTPDAVQLLAMFLARTIVDEIVPPAFLTTVLTTLRDGALGVQVVRMAGAMLSARHAAERVLNCWHGGAFGAQQLRSNIRDALKEYIVSADAAEAARSLRELGVPFYYHEVVFRALELAFELPDKKHSLVDLLVKLAASGDITQTQMTKGFKRMEAALSDEVLDYPNAKEVFANIKNEGVEKKWLVLDE